MSGLFSAFWSSEQKATQVRSRNSTGSQKHQTHATHRRQVKVVQTENHNARTKRQETANRANQRPRATTNSRPSRPGPVGRPSPAPISVSAKYPVVNLHKYSVPDAIKKADQAMTAYKDTAERVTFVPGQGKHSIGGRPKIKPALEDHLRKEGYSFTEQEGNRGRIDVNMKKKQSSSIWAWFWG